MTPGLALFVKTPGLSPVKSRLWPAIGREAAEALYLDCAAAAGETAVGLQREGHAHAYWAVAELDVGADAAEVRATASPWLGLPRMPQGGGGLGERMARVYAGLRARHGAALLIGTDLPQLATDTLAGAARALDDGAADLVIGPSEDGGFWLVGGRVDLPLRTWTTPRYSTRHALDDFLAALPARVRVKTLDLARDLDDADDLPAVAAALAALPRLTATQEQVSRRLDALLTTMPR
jgi:hypothetical protein